MVVVGWRVGGVASMAAVAPTAAAAGPPNVVVAPRVEACRVLGWVLGWVEAVAPWARTSVVEGECVTEGVAPSAAGSVAAARRRGVWLRPPLFVVGLRREVGDSVVGGVDVVCGGEG